MNELASVIAPSRYLWAMSPRPRALKQGHAAREVCPKQAHAGSLGTRPSTVLRPPLSAAIKAKSAVAVWVLCGTLTETDTASFGDLCIKSRACTKVGARNPLVVLFSRPTNASDYPILFY